MSELPKGLVETTLGEVIKIYSGKTRPKQNGSFPVYGGNGILNYGDRYNQEGETIIAGRVGAYCGNMFFETEKSWLSDNALGVKANVKAKLRLLVKKVLMRYGYPPDVARIEADRVLEQSELLASELNS